MGEPREPDVLTEEKLKELWSLAQSSSSSPTDQPPFYVFNPAMYNEQYLEKMKNLQKKKDKKEKRAIRERSKNIKSSFVTENNDEEYDIDQVLKSLGEKSKKAKGKKSR